MSINLGNQEFGIEQINDEDGSVFMIKLEEK